MTLRPWLAMNGYAGLLQSKSKRHATTTLGEQLLSWPKASVGLVAGLAAHIATQMPQSTLSHNNMP